ncbi:MAG: PTS fructose transporter subunit IIA [Deltaproteobacteria bacterium]|nr:PTS fructose transporter subunit IIA [Deltaproteobacteria bacterium]
MIGITIITHRKLGDALIDAAGFILGYEPEAVTSVSIDINEKVDALRSEIAKSIKKVNRNKGVLILTDMFGGTPSNLSYSFLEEGKVEVISGVNLPVLIKAVGSREKMGLSELAAHLETYGKKSISAASGILKGNKKNK